MGKSKITRTKEDKMFTNFNIQDFVSCFFVLFAIIDLPGAIPIILNLRKKGKSIKPKKTSLLSLLMFFVFFYVGDAFLSLFGVDITSFAIAGSLIIFVMAIEMILDIEIFKSNADAPKDSSFFPVVFPLLAGAGALTTILSLNSQYAAINILLAIVLNCVCIYIALKLTKYIERLLGAGGIYLMKKFFGIILLAISVKLFTTNMTFLIEKILDVKII